MNITQKLSSRLDLVPEFISSLIKCLQEAMPLNEDDVFTLRLILEESLTNAIRHGNKLNPNLTVDVAINLHDNRLTIDIKDQGQGFDFHNVPNPTTADKLLKTSGRGVFLIKKLVDQVSFYDAGSGIKMIKVLNKSNDAEKI